MKKIQILGTGCPNCQRLAENAELAAREVGGYEIEKITEIKDIVRFGAMVTPALAVDGELKSAGRVLSSEEIKALLV